MELRENMVYRIYTEKKNVKAISQIVSEHFDGFTILFGRGYWEGKPEKSMVIEIITDPIFQSTNRLDERCINLICRKIKGLNRQDAVIFTRSDNIKLEVIQ